MQIYFSVVRRVDATTPSLTSEGGATWLDSSLHFVVRQTELTSEYNRFIWGLKEFCFREVRNKTQCKWIFVK